MYLSDRRPVNVCTCKPEPDHSTRVPVEPVGHFSFSNSLSDSVCSFDPASLAILQRLDALEELLRAKSISPLETAQSVDDLSPVSILKDLGSPSLERNAESVPCYINIEAVLSWPVFEDQNFEQRLTLKSLLQSDNDHAEQPPLSIDADFESRATGQLLQQFLDNVHIFNPVLEETKVKEYMRNASFNGLGWDAQSCLLVN
jgi:hypothetical protein